MPSFSNFWLTIDVQFLSARVFKNIFITELKKFETLRWSLSSHDVYFPDSVWKVGKSSNMIKENVDCAVSISSPWKTASSTTEIKYTLLCIQPVTSWKLTIIPSALFILCTLYKGIAEGNINRYISLFLLNYFWFCYLNLPHATNYRVFDSLITFFLHFPIYYYFPFYFRSLFRSRGLLLQ